MTTQNRSGKQKYGILNKYLNNIFLISPRHTAHVDRQNFRGPVVGTGVRREQQISLLGQGLLYISTIYK